MTTTVNFHAVVSVKVGKPRSVGDTSFWVRDIEATDSAGHSFILTLYAESEEQLADLDEDGRLTAAYADGRADEHQEWQQA